MKYKFAIIILFHIVFFALSEHLFQVGRSERANYEFRGKIENISYDEKMIPTIIVNGTSYYLRPIRDFEKNVEVEDLAVKKSGERTLRIIKKSNGRILNYNL